MWRNALQRRNHKERAQPLEREKWGNLEKHKDYALRAKDYNEKKKRLKILRQKAADRNPDEFHFEMMRSKTQNGGQKLAGRVNPVLTQEVAKLLKTQDAGYLRTMAQKVRKERERMEQKYILREGNGAEVLGGESVRSERKHMIFVESQGKQMLFKPEGFFGTSTGGLDRSFNRPRIPQDGPSDYDEKRTVSQLHQEERPARSRRTAENEELKLKRYRALRKQHKREQEVRRSRLESLKLREKGLLAAEQELELQRAKMSNSVGGVNKAGVKWKVRERKK